MRLSLTVVLLLSLASTPLLAAPVPAKAPPKAAAVDPIFASAMATAEKIRAAQQTVKPDQKFNLTKEDPRLAPSLEFNGSLLKIINSPTATVAQKRTALTLWHDFYKESQNWKPYYFVGTLVPKETTRAMRDFAFSQLQGAKGDEAKPLLTQFSAFAIFSSDREWSQIKAQELLTAGVRMPLREWALQIHMLDEKAPLAERLSNYRELTTSPTTILSTRDYYFTSFNTDLRYRSPEEKKLAKQLQEEVFSSSEFIPSTRFDVALSLSYDKPKTEDKLAIYDAALKINGLNQEQKASLSNWKAQLYADSKDYPNALKSWEEAVKQAGDAAVKERAIARYAIANLHTNVLKKPTDARPVLQALTSDENLNNDQMLQVVLWRANLELNEKKNANAIQVIEQGLKLKKLTVQQKDFLRFQQSQIQVLDKNHTVAVELIEKIPVQNLDPQVQQSGFDAMFGLSLDLANYDGAKAIIDLWSKRGGISVIDYALMNGLIFEARGNLPAALGVYQGVLPSITVQAAKDKVNAAIKRVEAAIEASKKNNSLNKNRKNTNSNQRNLLHKLFEQSMKQILSLLSVYSVLGLFATSSQLMAAPKPAPKPIVASPKAKPLYVVGRVLTMAGKPLSNVEIGIYGTTAPGDRTRFETRTAANGLFSQRVPDGIYGVSAYYQTTFNGKNYNFTLHPEDGKTGVTHDAASGVVKNFRWKISGLKPDQRAGEAGAYGEGNKYYGGYVSLGSKESGTLNTPIYFPQGSLLVVTMTPRGKLIDGSSGQPKTFRRKFDRDITSGISWYLTDLPIGLYNLTAAYYSPTGQKAALKAKKSLDFNGPFVDVVPVDFEPTNFGDMQMMQITVEPPVSG